METKALNYFKKLWILIKAAFFGKLIFFFFNNIATTFYVSKFIDPWSFFVAPCTPKS